MAPADILKKPYARLVIPDEDGTFSAEIVEFSGCIAVGSTPAEALSNLEETAVDWIAAALNQGQDIPEPLDSAGYSGKVVLRMSKGLHRKAALFAEREGISMNQFIITCLAEAIGEKAKPQPTQAAYGLMPVFRADAQFTLQVVPASGVPGTGPIGRQQLLTSGPTLPLPQLRALEPEHA